MALLTCDNLTIGYGNRTVVESLNFTIEAGDYLCILGENGAGKSTLVRTLLALSKPLGGELRLENGLTRNEIGYLPQQNDEQRDFPASVVEIVRSGFLNRCGLRPFYTRQERIMAMACLNKVGMAAFKRRCFRELSGGQQRRVLLARALCAAQKVLFLDEPAAGLDPQATTEMYELIQRLNRVEGIAIVMVSHNIRTAVHYAQHILHLAHSPKFFGTAEAYKESSLYQAFMDQEGCNHHHGNH